ncbi:hypothetical protein [Atlantibacter hermannii]|uniref:hypothetical protein n=1 Tax=Atlantibacter hermannii TaxID=565 RepID=UPI0028ABFE5C|nr:hypothetical protein [Atlantibacter hermannii]
MEKEQRYWLVGASWDGVDHQDEKFVQNHIWMLGWSHEEDKTQFEAAKEIRVGDRIAIKRMKGRGSPLIAIKHIGIVKGVVEDNERVICTVDWVCTHLNRDVPSKGCYASVHGPFTRAHDSSEWLNEIFSL